MRGEIKAYRFCEIFRGAESEMKSADSHAESVFHSKAISHAAGVFHPSARTDFTEKSTCNSKCFFLVEHIGFEPMTPTLPVWCASQLR